MFNVASMKTFKVVDEPVHLLFAFPHAGSSATAFYAWSSLLARHRIQLYVARYPGRGERLGDDLIKDTNQICCELLSGARTLLGNHPDLPFSLLGHSMGALFAFEVGKVLELYFENLQNVFLSAREAPPTPKLAEQPWTFSDAQFVQYIQERYQGIPQEILEDEDMLEMMLPVLRNDFELSMTYEPLDEKLLSVPVTVLCGESDETVSEEGLARWRDYCEGEFGLLELPGGHFFVYEEAQEVIDAILPGLS